MTMKIIFYVAVLLLAFWGYRHFNSAAPTIKTGQIAPSFNLADSNGNMLSLASLKGQWVVLYFYPKDDTPGCTKEACQFRDDLHHLEKLGAQVVGVSVDDRQSHAAFAKKYALPFPLLSDADGAVAAQYGALTNLGVMKIAKRYTFLIDPQGNIAKAYFNVEASTHSQQIIDDLQQLQKV
ncbi:MAG TPA: peroxiredoxin [Methylophilus sp.]